MTINSKQEQRKKEHLAIAERLYRQSAFERDQFAQVRLLHPVLPETNQAAVHPEQLLFNRPIAYPIYINAMTGGAADAMVINDKLAQLAAHFNLPMGVGSMSILKQQPELADTFTIVREQNPNGVIFANLGADHAPEFAQEMIDLIHADALQIHLNAAQEFAMPEGDQDFRWIDNLRALQSTVGQQTPLIAKEVGFGMSAASQAALLDLGFNYLDLSGISRTNFIAIEDHRRPTHLVSDYQDFGLTLIESLLARLSLRQTVQKQAALTFASGGIRTPWQAVKAFALGADLVGMSAYFLHLALHHPIEEMITIFQAWLDELNQLLPVFGCTSVADLRQIELIFSPNLISFADQIGLDWQQIRTSR